MTTIDLRVEYKRDTADDNVPISNSLYNKTEYIQWLEEQLLFIRNALAINQRTLSKLKEMEKVI